MKLRLPSRLVQALFTTCAAALTCSSPVFADVPEGYEPVTITNVDQLADYTKLDYIAFIISADVTNNAYKMKGGHQYWTDSTAKTHALIFTKLDGAAITNHAIMASIGSVTFSENSGDQGGALSSNIGLTKNDHVVFSGNTATYGGAIWGEGSITDNGSVEFIGNNATTEGGAIDSWDFVLSRNESVIFSGNTTNWDGGAIVNTGTLALSDNGSIEFRENFDGEAGDGGGAIRTYGAIHLTGNDKVAFSKNSTAGFGGAILAREQDIAINISNNGSVEFSGNSSAYDGGGAIYFNDTATLNITGNDHVVFRGNYEQGGLEPFYNLRSVYMHNWIGQMEIDEYEYMQNPEYYDSFKSNLNLSAGKGQDIVFYDPMYVCSGTNVYFNAESGATGDIVFSGKYAAEDLKALKEDYRDWELTNSLTTEVYNTTYLCGGRMNVEDGAIYKGNGIEVGTWMGTDATLRLANGTLDQEGIGIYMNTGSTLALEGVNSITAPDLFMGRNSTLAVTLGSENAETALLTLYGDFVWSQQLSVDVSYDEAAAAAAPLRIFDTCREGVPTGWTEQNVSVSGTTFDKLQWSEGILYLNLTGGDIPLLPSLEWAGGDMRWNTTSANWRASGAPATYSENAKVHFGDAGAGTVMLSGTLTPRSVEVENTTGHDYTFQGGCLTGGMHLTKNGEGVLTVKSANDYMGGTVLNAGTLVAGSSEAFGTGAIQINGGTLDLGGHSIGNDIAIAKGADFAIRNGCLNRDLEIVGGSMVADGLHLETQNLSITNAGSVVFRNAVSELSPYSWDGGAISGADIFCSLDISNNGNLVFTGNTAGNYGNGGAIYVASEYGTINITGNGNVTFSGNTACSGGAIYAEADSLNIANNDHVEFRGNYEIDTCQLRSIYSPYTACVSLSLTAVENQDIVFYDTLYVENGSYVDLNNWDNANGDIVFSGKYAKEDLAAWKPNYTEQELTDSLTSELYTTTYLYGGRLRVEDGAILKGNGISVETWTGSTPVIRLSEGTLDQTGYDITMNPGSTLDLERENHITASSLQLADDTVIHFMMGSGQQSAILSLDAMLQTGSLLASVDGDYANEHVLITLADAAQYDISAWTPDKVTVRGTNFAHLVWNEGSLYYRPADIKDITLADDTESDDEIDEAMSSGESVDIEGNGHKLTVKHPVDLVHLAMKDGVVKLEGEENNVVRITLTEDGTLQLAAGAGLNVGNIVSMVANGSADLVISGDIEISDVKAYGKPGNKGTLSYVNMTTAGDYTIENMTISGSVIDVGEGTTLYLVNVDIKADTHITDDPARVFAQNANIQLDKTNTWVDKEITAAQDTLLYMCGDTQRSITLAVGSEIVELTSSMFDSVTLTGTDLWLDMTGIAEATYGKDYFTLDFQDFAREMAKVQVDVENLHVYATLDGERYTEAYSTANGGLTTTLYFQVPEPATSTLSLLALAALAARRRRK